MICCVTGHRPKGFPFSREMFNLSFMYYQDALYIELKNLVIDGYTDFITGMADGADLDFAETVLEIRDDECFQIKLEAALPYPLPPTKRITEYSEKRDDILYECNSKYAVSTYYHKGCMQKRNQYMVDKSDIVLAIWNGVESGGTWNTIKYARSKGKPIRYIMLNDFVIDFKGAD